MLRPGATIAGADLVELVQGFLIMGDHRALLEAWTLLKPTAAQMSMTMDQKR